MLARPVALDCLSQEWHEAHRSVQHVLPGLWLPQAMRSKTLFLNITLVANHIWIVILKVSIWMETGMETLNYKLHLTRDYWNSGITNHFIYCWSKSTLHLLDYLMGYYLHCRHELWKFIHCHLNTFSCVAIFKSLPLPRPSNLADLKGRMAIRKMDWQNVILNNLHGNSIYLNLIQSTYDPKLIMFIAELAVTLSTRYPSVKMNIGCQPGKHLIVRLGSTNITTHFY